MKKLNYVLVLVIMFTFISCGGGDRPICINGGGCVEDYSCCEKEIGEPEEKKLIVTSNDNESDILGIYHAISPPYNLKNKFGDDMIVNGKTIPIPSIDHKFILEKGGSVSLQQTNMEDNTRYYYEGSFSIIEREEKWKKIECSLSDGEYSNPTYILTIWPLEDKALSQKSNEPDFMLKKIK